MNKVYYIEDYFRFLSDEDLKSEYEGFLKVNSPTDGDKQWIELYERELKLRNRDNNLEELGIV